MPGGLPACPYADPGRQAPLSALPDPRCDVCVFLLPPKALLEDGSHVEAVARLAQLLPVIPVVAKVTSSCGFGCFLWAGRSLHACEQVPPRQQVRGRS